MIRLLAALLLALSLTVPALADELRPSSMEFVQLNERNWQLAWKKTLVVRDPSARSVPKLPDGCALLDDARIDIAGLAALGSAKVRCAGPVAGLRLGMPALAGNEDALLRIAPLDRPVQAYRLTAAEPLATIAARPDAWQVWRSYFKIGMEHILAGWDHLLFVIALVLLVGGGWRVVGAATAFTLAHSITLVATTLGFVGLPQAPVEALIALSIVFLAVELAKGGDGWTRRFPWAVAFAFGLLHGFGFAGALREIGLPEGEVPAALISFNLGVEAGQILVILAVLAIRHAVVKFAPKGEAPALRFATYGIGIIGAYWLVDRVIA